MRPPVLAAAIVALGAASPPDPLAAIAAANGHAAAVHLRAGIARVVEGRTVTTTLDQLGTRRLVRRCVGEVCEGSWFDGTTEWSFGLNEVVLPETHDAATVTSRTLFAIVSYAFAEPAFRAGGGTVAAAGRERWRVQAPDGAPLVAELDPASKAVLRIESADGHPIARYERVARAGGASFALSRTGALESGSFDEVRAVTEPLAAPPGVLAALAGPDTLPLSAEAVPIVPCRLGGRSARCLLDTGATPSAMTLPFAEALRLEPHGELEISGFGHFATGFVEAGPLLLGPARFEHARFAVIPQSQAAGFDVVVGSDLLARVRVVFDRARRSLRILSAGSSTPGPEAIPLTFREGSPVIELAYGSNRAPALLDTGDQSILSIGYAAYRLGPQWPVLERGQALGITGAEDMFSVEIPSVRVGRLSLGTSRATVRRTQALPHVGIGLWDRFVVDLDEGGARISYFAPIR